MLPVIDNRPIEIVKLPYLKKSIKIRPYKGSQEKVLLNCLSDRKDRKKWLENILNVIHENIVDEELNLSELKIIDLIYLCFKLREMSKSQIFDYSWKCDGTITTENGEEKCGHLFDEHISIMDVLCVKNSDKLETLVKVNDTLEIELEAPNIDYLNYLSSLSENDYAKLDVHEKADKEMVYAKQIFELLVAKISYCVKKVIINNDGKLNVYNKSDFTVDELVNNVLMNLTMDEIQKLIQGMDSLINLTVKIKKKCPKCGKLYEQEDANFFQYLT